MSTAMALSAPRARPVNRNAPRRIGDLPRVALDSDHYRAIGFLRTVQMATRRQGNVLHLTSATDGSKVLLGDAAFGDAWRRNSRALIKDVDEYPASGSLARMLLDNNLTSAREGPEWEDMRAQVAPLMRYKLSSYADAVEDAARALVAGLSRTDTERPTLWKLCGLWSARTVAHPVLGFGFDDNTVLALVNELRQCMFHLVQAAPGTTRTKLRQDRTLIRTRLLLERAVRDAVACCNPEDETMVGTLLDARSHPRGRPAPLDLVAEVQPILVGALAATVHNNSLAMFWTLTRLAQNPDAAARIAAEGRASVDTPFHLNTAPMALASVREALRISPVLPFMERRAAADLVLAGLAIPRGTTVVMSPWVVHRDPANWPDPMQFDPDRFAPGKRIDLTRWFPFGLGHRACIGSNLALSQLTRSITQICCALHLAIPKDTIASYWQPTYRVLLEPREDGGRLAVAPRT